jgi:hypothetical protein
MLCLICLRQEDEQGVAYSTGWPDALDPIYKVVLGEVNIVSGTFVCMVRLCVCFCASVCTQTLNMLCVECRVA